MTSGCFRREEMAVNARSGWTTRMQGFIALALTDPRLQLLIHGGLVRSVTPMFVNLPPTGTS